MPWILPECSSIDFIVSGIYTVPSCNMINFDIGGTAPHQIQSEQGIIFIDAPTAEFFQGHQIQSELSDIYIDGNDSSIDLLWPIESFASDIVINATDHLVRGTEPQHLPTKTSLGGRFFSWNKSKLVNDHICMPFGEGEDILKHICFPVKDITPIKRDICSVWRTHWIKDNHIKSPWGIYPFIDYTTTYYWTGILDYIDNHSNIPWGFGLEYSDHSSCVLYKAPDPNDSTKCILYDESVIYDNEICLPWNAPGKHDVDKCVPYGPFSYYLLCDTDKYKPPKFCEGVHFHFPSKYELIGNVCSGITFHLDNYTTEVLDPRCPWRHVHSGIRDRYPGIQIPDVRFPIAQKVYYMLNSVLVKEVLTNQPIEVIAVNATIDRESWVWQFNVTVASLDCLEVIKPRDGVYAHIQIDINGYTWICTVEGWRETRAFPKTAWTIVGRSPSIMFADPIASKRSNTEGTAQQGETIFDNIVSDGSYIPSIWPAGLQAWTANWDTYNNTCTGFAPYSEWWIPSDTLSYTDKTPIEVLKNMAESIGAYIQTDPSDTVLHVKPMYAWQPWDWDDSNTHIDWKPIIEDQCKEIARSTKLNPYYQAIHVMGENVGGNNDGTGNDPSNTAIFVDIVRDGYSRAVATYAPMVTHPLVTSSKSGLEYGRMILGQTGEWIEHTLYLGVLCPGSASSGLFSPGDMITVLERGRPWYGQVTATTISALQTNNAFTVSQQIGVEEFIKPT